jgi:ribose/xylose/arabinose/galactoside ABC-type transport system permease subunit
MTEASRIESRLGKASRRPALTGLLLRAVRSEYFTLILCAAYAALAWPFVPVLFSAEVVGDIIANMMPLMILAAGQTFVLIVAGIDLSVTSVIALSGVVGASIMTNSGGYIPGNAGIPVALLAMMAVGVGAGLFNGFSVTAINMPPFLVTLATRMFFSGFAIWYTTFHTTSSSISDLPSAFNAISGGFVLRVPVAGSVLTLPVLPVVIATAAIVVAHVVLTRSRLGRDLYAVGANRSAARVSGINVNRTILLAFVISGLSGALAGVLLSSRLQTGTPILGENMLLDIIGAAVIGGTSLFGGRGKISWSISGVLFLVLLDTTLRLRGASLFVIYIMKGGVILVAATLDVLRNRMRAAV